MIFWLKFKGGSFIKTKSGNKLLTRNEVTSLKNQGVDITKTVATSTVNDLLLNRGNTLEKLVNKADNKTKLSTGGGRQGDVMGYKLPSELNTEKEGIKTFMKSNQYLKRDPLRENSIESIVSSTGGVLKQDEYISMRYPDSLTYSNAVYHVNPHGRTKGMIKQRQDDLLQHNELSRKLEILGSKEYNSLLERKVVRPPTRDESLLKKASGHSDNESVQAARRLLEKRKLKKQANNT